MANAENTPSRRTCPRCGAELPPNVPPELCPKCLLRVALGAQPATGPGGTVVLPPDEEKAPGLPQPGEQLGHYLIGRRLGGGGMGAVFEAEDTENGRRVALKVLSHALDTPEARERFLREGRLAASINHPNSVYVFGTEEIAGTPVIAMELVAGGTLEERVRKLGPMPPAAAVDAVLQVIAGLEAAQQIGILHRDIKPSNCFVDLDGTVKIGDFGLSISTSVRTEPALTVAGSFLGTPAFCSPEQLRGDQLNARADMYSVGATLFYLLTGRTPFDAKNTVALIATVLETPAPSPRDFNPAVPHGLAKVVRRCLEKEPGERFRSYEELRRALAPYGSTAPAAAPLGLRFLAGVLDVVVVGTASTLLLSLASVSPMAFLDLVGRHSPKAFLVSMAGLFASMLYYGLLEGLRGATVGKALCRLRVVRPDRTVPGVGRALLRAFIYVAVPALPIWIIYALHPAPGAGQNAAGTGLFTGSAVLDYFASLSVYVMFGLLFSTARRRNGFAALQDLLTQTRVISRPGTYERPGLPAAEAVPAEVETRPRVGPYHVLETLEEAGGAAWLLAYDLRLLRRIWLRTVPEGTPPVPPHIRTLGRPGRLRWLSGRRSPKENWDAYEALNGRPFLSLVRQSGAPVEKTSWSQVRYWLLDLAHEISAAGKDNTLPVLALDRVWITQDGRAKLLDFPAPGLGFSSLTPAPAQSPPPLPGDNRAQLFLWELAATALSGREESAVETPGPVAVRLPLHAREFLAKLPQFPNPESLLSALGPLLQRPAAVTVRRRLAVLAGCVALPVFFAAAGVFGMSLMREVSRQNPGLFELNMVLRHRWAARLFAPKAPRPTDQQYAVYVSSHFGPLIRSEAWSGGMALLFITGDERRFAEQSVAAHPAPSEQEVAQADAALKPLMPKEGPEDLAGQPAFPFIIATGCLFLFVGLPAVIAALLFRRGLILATAGIVFVRRDGAPASRLRLFWRALLAWSPAFAAMTLPGNFLKPEALGGALLVSGALVSLGLLSALLPQRGLPDSLAGTWPVPR